MEIGRWDHASETGHASPVSLVIVEDTITLAEITSPTPEDAIATALQLMEASHERQNRSDPMAMATARCAEIMNDATIMQAEMSRERREGPPDRRAGRGSERRLAPDSGDRRRA